MLQCWCSHCPYNFRRGIFKNTRSRLIGDIFSQYLYTTRSSEAFPIRCIIPDSPKFGNYKPIPRNGKSISVTGFLTGLKHNEDKTVKHFITSRSLASQWDLLRQRPKSVRPRYVSNSTPANLKFTGFFVNGSNPRSLLRRSNLRGTELTKIHSRDSK
ncbi:hypothetical protein B0H14DRAFT_2570151 [Mycena olivaceomarginata]|nr:hypothetical protein B0H14DRAFT_2570151 [Mycena olivaceomarginata]